MKLEIEMKPEDIKEVILEEFKQNIEWHLEKFDFWSEESLEKELTKAIKKELKAQLQNNEKNIKEMVADAIKDNTKDIALEMLHDRLRI